ncbi:estradiol 17 beta-dehydrogenase 5-like isoform X3 [Sciurus carolinensis]|uniref:estradiol 17 beta-dehydrogenase 5-like isoform X3 n=1 Tax=Sciurus carolinensis TaxID=30640 RepID=UPI001FB564B6|nr:estradiol 17 beta-dehydrogenase 5-like isoform X3 [Sciurus carolinensis]
MNSKHQYVELSDGHFIPPLGFGTYKLQEVPNSNVTEATKIAIEAGFRHIDCAYVYQVEEEVGLAIRSKIADGTVKREDIFYTSKLWSTFHQPELVQSCLERSLEKLCFDYVDLYLIHFPVTMKTGEELFPKDENGRIIYDSADLCAIWEVECHVYHNQRKLLDFCKSKGIVLVAYGALGTQRYDQSVDQSAPVLLDDPVLGALAIKHKRSPALIALRYQLQRGLVVLVKSFNEKRIKENIQCSLDQNPHTAFGSKKSSIDAVGRTFGLKLENVGISMQRIKSFLRREIQQ